MNSDRDVRLLGISLNQFILLFKIYHVRRICSMKKIFIIYRANNEYHTEI